MTGPSPKGAEAASIKGPRIASLSDVLGRALDNLGIMSTAKKYRVFSLWAKVVGDISRHAKPRRLSGDTLFVATASSAWSQELTFMRQSIIEKLNRALEGEYVREIRFSEHLWDSSDERPASSDSFFPLMAVGEGSLVSAFIADSALANSARRFSSTMARRRHYLLRQGYKVCPTCGCLYPSTKLNCPYCQVKKEFLARERAIAILDKAPYMSDEEVLALIGSSDKTLVERVREELESRCLILVRNFAARETRGAVGDFDLASAIARLAALRSGKPAEELSKEELENAVGKRLLLAAKKGRPWRHGSTSGRKM